MIRLTIDNRVVEVAEGSTILQAAGKLGIGIPTMCHLEGISVQPSCMVCTVKDLNTGKLHPSCSMPAGEGMNIDTCSDEINAFRKSALELLLSDHVGDCEAPCRLTCPAYMNIPLMNRLIASGKFGEALSVVYEEIALPLILGYICPAPCEKACKRKPIDGSVSICLLKRFTADDPERYNTLIQPASKTGKRVAIIGTGPAGLSAAFYLQLAGHECLLFDKEEEAGGALRYSIPDAELPRTVLDAEIDNLKRLGATFILGKAQSVSKLEINGYGRFDAFILATGNPELHPLVDVISEEIPVTHHFINRESFQTSVPGVFACGSIVKDLNMAVKAGHQGKLAARNIILYLQGLPAESDYNPFNSVIGLLKQEEYGEYLKESIISGRTLPAAGFMGGLSIEEAVAEAQRCMHCDCRKPASCKLRIYSDQYHADRRHFAGNGRKRIVKTVQHELVIYEPEKCIKCGLCVEIASRDKESLGLAFIGRGFDVQVSVPFNKTMDEALKKLSLECVNACPTGALAAKDREEATKSGRLPGQ